MMGSISKNHNQDNALGLQFLIVKALLIFYSIITLPIYFLIQQPWRIWKDKKTVWAKHTKEGDPYSPVKRVPINYTSYMEDITTMDELFRRAVSRHRNNRCHGVRKILKEIEETDNTGKVFKKLRLGSYHWFSYIETNESVKALAEAFLALGLQPKRPIIIFAETRREWFLTLQACFRINIPVATLYATLGEEGIIHGINETEVSTVVTSQGLLPKLKKIAKKLPAVSKIIYMDNIKPADTNGFPPNMSIFKFSDIKESGVNCENVSHTEPPSPNDLAVIMYTNGSTGIPKGVLITHTNILATIVGFMDPLGVWNGSDINIAYLPLAHIYEIMVECLLFHIGVVIGYSSPHTLMDESTGLIAGCKGDITLLQPTIFCAVPLMMNRMRKSVNEAIATKGSFFKRLFNYAVQYKADWWERGFTSPILNKLLFGKIQQLLGGRVKYIISAGAHLSADTQIFIRTCFDVKLITAYAMTESAASATLSSTKDFNAGRVGAPIPGCSIKLVDWDEGGYKVTDKPHPRGEIVVGGECISLGYFKNEKLTKEVYKEEDGNRWFYSGDVGELFPDGTFKIIDRKKDLQKLQLGEYVSLGKIEAEMTTSPLVDNICVVGSNIRDYLIALVVPNKHQLRKMALEMGKEDLALHKLCQEKDLLKVFTTLFKNHGKKNALQNQEIPQKIKLCPEEWLPDTGLVTAALKIRRKPIENFYKDAIDKMFAGEKKFN